MNKSYEVGDRLAVEITMHEREYRVLRLSSDPDGDKTYAVCLSEQPTEELAGILVIEAVADPSGWWRVVDE